MKNLKKNRKQFSRKTNVQDLITRTGLIGGSERLSRTSFQLTFLKNGCERISEPSAGPEPKRCDT